MRVAKARGLSKTGWMVEIIDSDRISRGPPEFDRLLWFDRLRRPAAVQVRLRTAETSARLDAEQPSAKGLKQANRLPSIRARTNSTNAQTFIALFAFGGSVSYLPHLPWQFARTAALDPRHVIRKVGRNLLKQQRPSNGIKGTSALGRFSPSGTIALLNTSGATVSAANAVAHTPRAVQNES